MSKSNYFGNPLYRLIVAAFTFMCLGLVHAANPTEGMSELQRKLYAAVLNQPNEVWAENQPFMEEFKKTNGSEASLLLVKQKYSYAEATEQMTIAKARKAVPELAGLTDPAAFEVIRRNFYPTADIKVAGRILDYTPQPIRKAAWLTSHSGLSPLLVDELARALPSVLFFWGIGYFLLLRTKKVELAAPVALVHIGVLTVAVALMGAAFGNAAVTTLAALVLALTSCLILQSGKSKSKAYGS